MLISNPFNSHSQEDLGRATCPGNKRLVVSWTRGNKWSSAFDKRFYPLQNCWLNVLKQDVDELTAAHFIARMQFDPGISLQPAPGFDSVCPQWCRPRKIPSLWTLSENSKGYQHLWNSEKKKVYLLSKTSMGWNIWYRKCRQSACNDYHTFIFASTVRMEAVHTVLRLIMFSTRLYWHQGLSTSYIKIVFCGECYFINARDRFIIFSRGFVKNWRYNIKFLMTLTIIRFQNLKILFLKAGQISGCWWQTMCLTTFTLTQRYSQDHLKGRFILAWLTWKITWIHINEVNYSL